MVKSQCSSYLTHQHLSQFIWKQSSVGLSDTLGFFYLTAHSFLTSFTGPPLLPILLSWSIPVCFGSSTSLLTQIFAATKPAIFTSCISFLAVSRYFAKLLAYSYTSCFPFTINNSPNEVLGRLSTLFAIGPTQKPTWLLSGFQFCGLDLLAY